MNFSWGALSRALRNFFIPTVYAPSAPPGQSGGASLKHQSGIGTSKLLANIRSAVDLSAGGPLRTAYRENIPESVRIAIRKGAGMTGAGAKVPQFTGSAARFETTPSPSQPSVPGSAQIAAMGRALAPGGFAARTPAPVGPISPIGPVGAERVGVGPAPRAPIATPAAAPAPAVRPPAPSLPGGGVRLAGGGRVPEEAALPPTPTLPAEISRPIGQFDAMIRALQMLQADIRDLCRCRW